MLLEELGWTKGVWGWEPKCLDSSWEHAPSVLSHGRTVVRLLSTYPRTSKPWTRNSSPSNFWVVAGGFFHSEIGGWSEPTRWIFLFPSHSLQLESASRGFVGYLSMAFPRWEITHETWQNLTLWWTSRNNPTIITSTTTTTKRERKREVLYAMHLVSHIAYVSCVKLRLIDFWTWMCNICKIL